MATANIRFSDLSSISFNDDWKGCANYQRVPFAQKFLPTDYMTVQFSINSDAPLPVIQVIDKCTGRPFAFTLTYMLDFATPETVTVEVAPGTLVSLQTPAELGFTLPTTHIFQAWTYLGQDITEIVVREDIVVEGRTDVVGENLLKGSRRPVLQSGFVSGASFIDHDNNFDVLPGEEYDELVNIRNTHTTYMSLYPVPNIQTNVPPENHTVVLSGIIRRLSISSNIMFNTKVNSLINLRLLIDGVEIPANISGDEQTIYFMNVIPAGDTSDHVFELIQNYKINTVVDLLNVNIKILGNPVSVFTPVAIRMLKLEDVTNRAPADQRATAWVPHVDDPVEGTVIPPIDPNLPTAVAGSTDLAQNLIQRYSNGTDTIYDLPIEVAREGDYEVQFSYGDTVIARSSFAIREELRCSKLLQYNNRENDFSTIFTPGQPFYTRVEGEFRPEDDEYGVEDSDFRDQDYSLHQMSASPTTVRKLSFGGEYGSPNFIGNKVNRIFACSEVYIDGERYIRAEGAGVTKEVWSEDYPKYPWKINVEKREQGFFKAEYDIPETT